MRATFAWSIAGTLLAASLMGADGLRLESYTYPFPPQTYSFKSQQQDHEMVYMDVRPAEPSHGTVVLLHGKNFSGSYFGETARALRDAGFRVIIPDQVGFGKSTKPSHYQYSLHQLAANTHGLLASLEVKRVHVLGHSMGGMLATRFALMHPEATASLTLLNPIGLEDWKALGVPYAPLDHLYQQELARTPEQLKAYQLRYYYDNQWREAYDPWVEQLASFTRSPDYPRMAWNAALTSDMIFTQPVVYEFPRLRVPTLLIIGQRDRTAIGRDQAPEELKERLGNYPQLGRAAQQAIPGAKLVELHDVGHLPHIEAFPRFIESYLSFLRSAAAP